MSRGSRKRDRKRNRTRGRRGQQRRSTRQPISMVIGGEPDCSCPVCAEMAARGQPVMVMTPDGELVERILEPRPMMDVHVQGTRSTAPHFGPEVQRVSVPVGCVVGDLLEHLCFEDQAVRIAFPPGSLQARIGGLLCEPEQVLLRGDTVVLSAVPQPGMDRERERSDDTAQTNRTTHGAERAERQVRQRDTDTSSKFATTALASTPTRCRTCSNASGSWGAMIAGG